MHHSCRDASRQENKGYLSVTLNRTSASSSSLTCASPFLRSVTHFQEPLQYTDWCAIWFQFRKQIHVLISNDLRVRISKCYQRKERLLQFSDSDFSSWPTCSPFLYRHTTRTETSLRQKHSNKPLSQSRLTTDYADNEDVLACCMLRRTRIQSA
jgi:hypothetical protein